MFEKILPEPMTYRAFNQHANLSSEKSRKKRLQSKYAATNTNIGVGRRFQVGGTGQRTAFLQFLREFCKHESLIPSRNKICHVHT